VALVVRFDAEIRLAEVDCLDEGSVSYAIVHKAVQEALDALAPTRVEVLDVVTRVEVLDVTEYEWRARDYREAPE
jgi:hypothetical protein